MPSVTNKPLMLGAIMLNVIMLSVIMLGVLAPNNQYGSSDTGFVFAITNLTPLDYTTTTDKHYSLFSKWDDIMHLFLEKLKQEVVARWQKTSLIIARSRV
jgi:hypothetical protein